jgi:hypothetical protein
MSAIGVWLTRVLVIGLAVWLVWSMTRSRYAFEIRIHDGQPSLRRGKVTAAFLTHVALVCQETGVVHGWIGGRWHGKRVALCFSRQFPPGVRQRLRNDWPVVG